MFAEEDLLSISALQHLLFCERQCALIHVERLWAENRLTVEGQQLHKRAHAAASEWRDRVFTARTLRVRSLELGLYGNADVVEFILPGNMSRPAFVAALNSSEPSAGAAQLLSQCKITPIEYKRGRPKRDDSDRVQLCAQGLCLEEMLGVHLPAGAIFYGKQRRRHEVLFDDRLREATIAAARRLHYLVSTGHTPPAKREPKCESCSLVTLCMPDALAPASASSFFSRELAKHLKAEAPETDLFDQPEAAP